MGHLIFDIWPLTSAILSLYICINYVIKNEDQYGKIKNDGKMSDYVYVNGILWRQPSVTLKDVDILGNATSLELKFYPQGLRKYCRA